MPYVPILKEAGNLKAKLCVVLGYNCGTGRAFVNVRGFSGNAVLPQSEIEKAGWTELCFGVFIMADIEQTNGSPRATNIREATAEDFQE